MHTTELVSVVIPSRNEKYLKQTILDLLHKAKGKIQVIAVLDGYWPEVSELVLDDRVNYIKTGEAKGMRNGINMAVELARGEYILKTDAHCLFAEGFDEVLKADCKDNWVIVPRRFPLDPDKWEIEKRNDNKYPVDYMYLSKDLHGEPWPERRDDPQYKDKLIDDLMSAQGSCWFMKKKYYQWLELLDEEHYGSFYNEFQEIGLKVWLSGGVVKVNKKTWYAHWHKPKDVGRGYSLQGNEQEKAVKFVKQWVDGRPWHKQTYDFMGMINRFSPVPTWS